jgi:hypothetical protein
MTAPYLSHQLSVFCHPTSEFYMCVALLYKDDGSIQGQKELY